MSRKLYILITHNGHIVNLDQLSLKSEQDNLIRESRKRWIEAKPDLHLTWNKQISGDAFIELVLKYTTIQSGTDILEIGPGKGRLLKSILNQNLPFDNYYGVDISVANIVHLKKTFQKPNIYYIQGNAEDIKLDTTFDIVISSLTFKHMYPSFEKSLSNISQYVNKKGMIFFDLIQGNLAFFDKDTTFMRYYEKAQVKDMVHRSNLKLIGFDKVTHAPGFSRLLVVTQKG